MSNGLARSKRRVDFQSNYKEAKGWNFKNRYCPNMENRSLVDVGQVALAGITTPVYESLCTLDSPYSTGASPSLVKLKAFDENTSEREVWLFV